MNTNGKKKEKKSRTLILVCVGVALLILCFGVAALLASRSSGSGNTDPAESGQTREADSSDVSPAVSANVPDKGKDTEILPSVSTDGTQETSLELLPEPGKETSAVILPRPAEDGAKPRVTVGEPSADGEKGKTGVLPLLPDGEAGELSDGDPTNRADPPSPPDKEDGPNPFEDGDTDITEKKGDDVYGDLRPGEGKHF